MPKKRRLEIVEPEKRLYISYDSLRDFLFKTGEFTALAEIEIFVGEYMIHKEGLGAYTGFKLKDVDSGREV